MSFCSNTLLRQQTLNAAQLFNFTCSVATLRRWQRAEAIKYALDTKNVLWEDWRNLSCEFFFFFYFTLLNRRVQQLEKWASEQSTQLNYVFYFSLFWFCFIGCWNLCVWCEWPYFKRLGMHPFKSSRYFGLTICSNTFGSHFA